MRRRLVRAARSAPEPPTELLTAVLPPLNRCPCGRPAAGRYCGRVCAFAYLAAELRRRPPIMETQPEPTHPCPARRCPREVPDHLLFCGIHWRLVPRPLQRAVHAAWRGGAGRGSTELVTAQRLAIRAVNDLIERTPTDA
jgi:hypothetical protein